jgi:branched-chain amino acid transport system permease protein
LGISVEVLLFQILIGLINGSFYVMLSLGLAVIFGLLRIINFAHGAQFMMGAFCAVLLARYAGLNYWVALLAAPLLIGGLGMIIERTLLKRIYRVDHLYSLILTFGLALFIEGTFRAAFGGMVVGYNEPPLLSGGWNLGLLFLPKYRAWVFGSSLLLCFVTWYVVERTRIGAYLRASTENPALVQAFGINVPLMLTLTYGVGVALAAIAGVMAAPIYTVDPSMGSNLMIMVFAIVVIGGMGSIVGAIVSGYAVGLIEGLTRYFYPEGAGTAVFVVMIVILLVKPSGLFGRPMDDGSARQAPALGSLRPHWTIMAAMIVLLLVAPFIVYSGFVMKFLCYALFACAFNLLLGYVGLLSFGQAAFYGSAAYATAYALKSWGWNPEFGIVLGVAVAVLLGYVFAKIATRLQGISFGMITLALGQIAYFVFLRSSFTGGENGLQGVPRGRLFGLIDLNQPLAAYYFILVLFLIGFLVIYRTIHSPFGTVLRAIRENETRAISLGYEPNRYKVRAIVIAAAMAGLAGSAQTLVFQIATLSDADFIMSGQAILMTLVGGAGTIFGPIVGAAVIVAMEQYLASFGSLVTVIQGAIFVACVLAFRRGIVGELGALWRLRHRRRTAQPTLPSNLSGDERYAQPR